MRSTMTPGSRRLSDRRAAVSIMFATMAIPLVLITGLAIDYTTYVQVEADLSTAADVAAMHAVRLATVELVAGQTVSQAIAAGNAAGKQWWDSQISGMRNASVLSANVHADNVTYNDTTESFSDTVSFNGTVSTLMAGGITGRNNWNIGGSASASIASLSFVEIAMLVDNSSSMLIGTTPADIIKLENLTICAPTATAIAAAQNMTAYSWQFPGGTGYGKGQVVPAKNTVIGNCDPNFTGGAAQCQSPQSYSVLDAAGYCPAGTGIPDTNGRIDPGTHLVANIPQAPCGFACHTGDGVHDYYTVARSAGKSNLSLRVDVIQDAMKGVVTTMQGKQQVPGQFALGVYQFNSAVSQVYPSGGGAFKEADTDLAQGETNIAAIEPPNVPDLANTNFPGAIQYLATNLTAAGDGTSPTKRRKNIFIVTDGLEDFPPTGGRAIGPMTTVSPEPYCSQLKSLGFNVYVLYTPYYPLPNEFYLNNGPRTAVEPVSPPALTNPLVASLQACASKPTQYFQASDKNGIDAAMQQMVQSAIASPGRITN